MSKPLALAYIVAITITVYTSYQYGLESGIAKGEAELKLCAEEVSSGCPNVTTYAVMLEKENARLNKKCRKSNVK